MRKYMSSVYKTDKKNLLYEHAQKKINKPQKNTFLSQLSVCEVKPRFLYDTCKYIFMSPKKNSTGLVCHTTLLRNDRGQRNDDKLMIIVDYGFLQNEYKTKKITNQAMYSTVTLITFVSFLKILCSELSNKKSCVNSEPRSFTCDIKYLLFCCLIIVSETDFWDAKGHAGTPPVTITWGHTCISKVEAVCLLCS